MVDKIIYSEQTTDAKYPIKNVGDNIEYLDLSSETIFTDYDGKKRKMVFTADRLGLIEGSKFVSYNPLTYEQEIKLRLFILELPDDPNGNNEGNVSVGPRQKDGFFNRHKYKLNRFKPNNEGDLDLYLSTQPRAYEYHYDEDMIRTELDDYKYNGKIMETNVVAVPSDFNQLSNGKTTITYHDAVIVDVNVGVDTNVQLTLDLGKWLSSIEITVPTVSKTSDVSLLDTKGLVLPFKSRLVYTLLSQDKQANTSTFRIDAGFVLMHPITSAIGAGNFKFTTNKLMTIEETHRSTTMYNSQVNRFVTILSEKYTFKHDDKGYLNDMLFNVSGSTSVVKAYVNELILSKDDVPRIKQKSEIPYTEVLGLEGTDARVMLRVENKAYTHKWDISYDRDSEKGEYTEEYFKKQSGLGGPTWLSLNDSFGTLEAGVIRFPMLFNDNQKNKVLSLFAIDRKAEINSHWSKSEVGFLRVKLETYDENDILIGNTLSYWKIEKPTKAKVEDSNDKLDFKGKDENLKVPLAKQHLNNDKYKYEAKLKDSKGNVLATDSTGKGNFPLTPELKDSISKAYPDTNYADLTTELDTYYDGTKIGTETGKTKVDFVNLDMTILKPTGVSYLDINPATLAITSNNSKIIQGSSNLKVTIAANTFKPADGAYSSKYIITLGDILREVDVNFVNEYSLTFTFEELKNLAYDSDLSVVAIDSRGNKIKIVKMVTVIPYIEPKIFPNITLISNFDKGVYVEVSIRVSHLQHLNELSNISVRYKQESETENWVNLGVLNYFTYTSTDEYTIYKTQRVLLPDVDLNTANYFFEYTTYDRLKESVEMSYEAKREQIAIIDSVKGSFGFGRQPLLEGSVALNNLEIGDATVITSTEKGIAFSGTFELNGLDLLETIRQLQDKISALEK